MRQETKTKKSTKTPKTPKATELKANELESVAGGCPDPGDVWTIEKPTVKPLPRFPGLKLPEGLVKKP